MITVEFVLHRSVYKKRMIHSYVKTNLYLESKRPKVNMKRIPLSLFTFLFLLSGLCAAPTKTVWQIGEKNHSASELALSPDKYKEFLANDFGWEDRFYIIGLSSPQKIFLMFCRDLPIIGEEQVILPVYGLMF